jgi:phenylacetic acid degradation operon negative regulatory protein
MQPVTASNATRLGLARLRPRSMLFTLFGDYIYPKGGEIRLGALVAIGAVLGMSEAAVRSAVARLARERWILARRRGRTSSYRLSPAGRDLIAEGTQRIYRANGRRWNGTWCLLTYSVPESQRALRDRMRRQLAWLGFGALGAGIYVAARDRSDDVRGLARAVGASTFARTFLARTAGETRDAQLVAACWDLRAIDAAYRRFVRRYARRLARDRAKALRGRLADAEAFVTRFALTHDFRRFPFIDPDLPDALLPRAWAGRPARALFSRYHAMLAEGALRFFESCARASSSGYS